MLAATIPPHYRHLPVAGAASAEVAVGVKLDVTIEVEQWSGGSGIPTIPQKRRIRETFWRRSYRP